jgi:23S rRNA (cytidine2498-2'-O)-methyltransferase
VTIQPYPTVYVAQPEFISELCTELGEVADIKENLVVSTLIKPEVCFAQDIWFNVQKFTFSSISQAVKFLRTQGKFWYLHPVSHIRRSRLIEEQLRKMPELYSKFPLEEKLPVIGVFSLLDKNTMIFSAQRQKKWPDGKCFFIEDKVNPPNRAYLKLWEALTLLKKYPQANDSALDLGASPGGWTYVMQSFNMKVTAVDKAPLAEHIMKLPGVNFLQQSAFALDPFKLETTYDWVLSDIACYPHRARDLILKWLDSGKAKQLIFTIKLQGETDLQILQSLKEIPNSRVMHLFYNKHEATFFHPWDAQSNLKL